MRIVRQTIPRILAVLFGIVTLVILGFAPNESGQLTGWASFLAAVALILGILNLFSVHIRRIFKGNFYSLVLVIGLLATLVLGFTDLFGGVATVFTYVQAPLEAALGALLAFFLFFAALRLLHRSHSLWTALFVLTVVLVLLGITPLPAFLSDIFSNVSHFISIIFVSAGMRGILIGVALGTITVTLRLLLGAEQPYNK
ncbi:MAG: hypothetical protein WAM60_14190 [Candidatus Promineifilaceae bacterium]